VNFDKEQPSLGEKSGFPAAVGILPRKRPTIDKRKGRTCNSKQNEKTNRQNKREEGSWNHAKRKKEEKNKTRAGKKSQNPPKTNVYKHKNKKRKGNHHIPD